MATASGRLFIWGKCTRNEADEEVNVPKAMPHFFNIKVKAISCGSHFTAVLTDDAKVYTIGSRSWFIPTDEHSDSEDHDTTIKYWAELTDKIIVQITCGNNFMAALTAKEEGGYVYTWGTGTFGQLGIEEDTVKIYDEFKIPIPTRVEGLQNIKCIAAGEECMGAVTATGKVFTWGRGYTGTLGLGDNLDRYQPVQVESLAEENIVSLRCGSSHMAALNDIGEIFTWGNNYLGPLGRILEKGKENDSIPNVVELIQTGAVVSEENLKGSDEYEFIQVECLKYNTIALSKNGQLFSCGKGGSDGGGHGDQPHTLLCLLESTAKFKVKQIASSRFSHTGAIVKTSNRKHAIYMWGNGEDGKLGFGDAQPQLYPRLLLDGRDCYDLACGETHSAAILEPLPTDINPDPSAVLGNVSGDHSDEDGIDNVELVSKDPEAIKQTTYKSNKEDVIDARRSTALPNNETDEKDSQDDDDDDDYSSEEDDDDIKKPTTKSTSSTPETTDKKYAKASNDFEKPAPVVVKPAPVVVKPQTSPQQPQTSPQQPIPLTRTQSSRVNIETIDKDTERNFLRSEFESSHSKPLDRAVPAPQSSTSNTTLKRTGTTAVLEDVQGYLNKKGDKGIVKLWRKRHFKMNMNTVEYYEKEDSAKKGIIKLSDVLDVLPGQVKYGFNLVSRTGRIYELQAFDNESFVQWSQGIRARLRL